MQLGPHAPDIVAGGAVLLWIGVVLVWLWPFPSQPWTFQPAEVQFFFTAPVTRRRLLNYKLLRSQLGVLFTVLMIAIFSGAARAAAPGAGRSCSAGGCSSRSSSCTFAAPR